MGGVCYLRRGVRRVLSMVQERASFGFPDGSVWLNSCLYNTPWKGYKGRLLISKCISVESGAGFQGLFFGGQRPHCLLPASALLAGALLGSATPTQDDALSFCLGARAGCGKMRCLENPSELHGLGLIRHYPCGCRAISLKFGCIIPQRLASILGCALQTPC